MESNISIYISLILLTTFFAFLSGRIAVKKRIEVWKTFPFYLLLFVFAFLAGTRYMVGLDYEVYMQIVEIGDSHFYYDSMEFLNRFFVDLVNNLNLDFYWWFIFMAFVQIFFICIAVKGNFKKVFPWIVFCFFLLFINFYFNGVRQGAAMSCFICAATFIKDKKLYHYLIFIFIGFLFHKSIIIWSPVYWIVNKELFKNVRLQYILLGLSVLVLPVIFDTILQKILPYMSMLGYEGQANTLSAGDENIAIGSGLGVLFGYLRWIIIIAYYNKLKAVVDKEEFIPIYNLFFIGVLLDAATMHVIYLARIAMYGTMCEIFILGTLFYYMTKTKNKTDKMVISVLFILQVYLSFMSVFNGTYKWYSIWNQLV